MVSDKYSSHMNSLWYSWIVNTDNCQTAANGTYLTQAYRLLSNSCMTATFVIQLEWLYLIPAVLNYPKEESNFRFAEVLTGQFLSVLGINEQWVQKCRWVAIQRI